MKNSKAFHENKLYHHTSNFLPNQFHGLSYNDSYISIMDSIVIEGFGFRSL